MEAASAAATGGRTIPPGQTLHFLPPASLRTLPSRRLLGNIRRTADDGGVEQEEDVAAGTGAAVTLVETGAAPGGNRTGTGTGTARGGQGGRLLGTVVVVGAAGRRAKRDRAREGTRGAGAAAGSGVALIARAAEVWSAVGA